MKLDELRKSGAITDQEFDAQEKKLLGEKLAAAHLNRSQVPRPFTIRTQLSPSNNTESLSRHSASAARSVGIPRLKRVGCDALVPVATRGLHENRKARHVRAVGDQGQPARAADFGVARREGERDLTLDAIHLEPIEGRCHRRGQSDPQGRARKLCARRGARSHTSLGARSNRRGQGSVSIAR